MSIMTLDVGTALRCPCRDPQVGDCLKKFGANHRPLYRLVTFRDGMRIKYCVGAESVEKEVWLSSWQDWSAGADIETTGRGDPVSVLDFFGRLLVRDKEARRRKAD